MKCRHSRSLGKQVFDEFRHFLHNNHRYWISKKHLFNGKEETSSRPRRMTPHLWKLEYDRLNRRGNVQFVIRSLKFVFWYYLIFTNAIIDTHEGHQCINDQLPRGMKIYPTQFSRLPHYKNLSIMHFFMLCILERM